MNIEIRSISAIETYPVRHPVLRAGRPIEDCHFKGDELPTTLHVGAFIDEKIAAVATFLLHKDTTVIELQHHENEKCYQLRGMAVLEEMQGKQLGKKLLENGEHLLKKNNGTALWFNARINAVPFYEKQGYKVISEAFEIVPIGIHYKMYKSL